MIIDFFIDQKCIVSRLPKNHLSSGLWQTRRSLETSKICCCQISFQMKRRCVIFLLNIKLNCCKMCQKAFGVRHLCTRNKIFYFVSTLSRLFIIVVALIIPGTTLPHLETIKLIFNAHSDYVVKKIIYVCPLVQMEK